MSSNVTVASTRSSKAQARWRFLQSALMGTDSLETSASIHRFPGFQLLSRTIVNNNHNDDFVQQLFQQEHDVEDMESLLWAIQCCYHHYTSEKKIITLSCNDVLSQEQVYMWRTKFASKGLFIWCPHSDPTTTTATKTKLSVQLPRNTKYICVDYTLSNHTVRVRETHCPTNQMTLSSLVSHHIHDGVDNTGNTRIWDTESTLAFLLHEEPFIIHSTLNISSLWELGSKQQHPLHVLELGCGMAGLASLFVAIQNPNRTRVVLTDGHPEAVQNNRIHIHLNPVLQGAVTAKRLLWSTNDTSCKSPCDLIVASDCTHVQEFHASLAWTIANQLRIGGVAILLQPPRGTSLANFVACLMLMNDKHNDWMQVDWIKSHYSETLTRLHEQEQQSNAMYDPDIHYPQVLILRKLRNVTEEDRCALLRHVEERESRRHASNRMGVK